MGIGVVLVMRHIVTSLSVGNTVFGRHGCFSTNTTGEGGNVQSSGEKEVSREEHRSYVHGRAFRVAPLVLVEVVSCIPAVTGRPVIR
jgi:hypothetical protein